MGQNKSFAKRREIWTSSNKFTALLFGYQTIQGSELFLTIWILDESVIQIPSVVRLSNPHNILNVRISILLLLQKSLPPFLVFRSQLGRINRFYPFDPPPEVSTWKPELIPGNFSSLCRVCGCGGNKKCAGCKKVCYCSKTHQTSDWKERWKKNTFFWVASGGLDFCKNI